MVLSPPEDIDKFQKIILSEYTSKKKQDIILVISRFSPNKKVENALVLAKLLKDGNSKKIMKKAQILITGNIAEFDYKYLHFLKQKIMEYGLQNFVKLMPGVTFNQLLELMSKSKVYFHPLEAEPFGISIVEAMASGLVPVVPIIGGRTEFVPQQYQYHSIQHAAGIISKILLEDRNNNNKINNKNTNTLKRSINISNLVSKFSIQNYKNNLKNIIQFSLKTVGQGLEEVLILNEDKRQFKFR